MVKKGISIIIIISICVSVFVIFFNYKNDITYKEELRLRIISNSNSEVDQKNKQIIKETLIEILKDGNLDVNYIEEELIGVIDDNITVAIKKSYYPAKTYNNKFIPAGVYNTLLITIGEGKGSNFWTLLYPEYFNITFEEENEIEYRFYLIDIIKTLFV